MVTIAWWVNLVHFKSSILHYPKNAVTELTGLALCCWWATNLAGFAILGGVGNLNSGVEVISVRCCPMGLSTDGASPGVLPGKDNLMILEACQVFVSTQAGSTAEETSSPPPSPEKCRIVPFPTLS